MRTTSHRPATWFEVWYKPDRGRWRVLATAPARAAAVARKFALMEIHPGGGWHVRACGPEPAGELPHLEVS